MKHWDEPSLIEADTPAKNVLSKDTNLSEESTDRAMPCRLTQTTLHRLILQAWAQPEFDGSPNIEPTTIHG